MNLLKNLQIVTGVFFYLFGFVFFILALLIHNQFNGNTPLILLKTLDLPFAFIALLYGGLSLRSALGENIKSDMLDAVLMFIGVFLFALIVYLNFAFPDFI